jgi:glycosyltransferase involved in cell wall biosynthesis
MPEISVIICTHNPRPNFLQRVLDTLQTQTLPTEQWEFLLIDNASKEPLSKSWDLSWHPHARHIREDELGLTPARLRGIQESTGGLLVFADDDNLFSPDYLRLAFNIHAKYPHLGVFGAGVLEPEFEVIPPKEILPNVGMLALRKVNGSRWSNNPHDASCVPWGAGLCATRKIANHFSRLIKQLDLGSILGRSGNRLTGGEDDLFTWASVQMGQGFGIFNELQITHLISAGRLSQSYFLRLVEGHHFSHGVMDYLLAGTQPWRPNVVQKLRMFLGGMRKGMFALRWQRALLRGIRRADQFIIGQRLKPVTMPITPANQ